MREFGRHGVGAVQQHFARQVAGRLKCVGHGTPRNGEQNGFRLGSVSHFADQGLHFPGFGLLRWIVGISDTEGDFVPGLSPSLSKGTSDVAHPDDCNAHSSTSAASIAVPSCKSGAPWPKTCSLASGHL